jgi:hypothetical protein
LNETIILLNSIKSEGLGPKKNRTSKTSKSIFKISLSLALIAFVLTMTPASSFFQIVKPAEAAGTLTSMNVIPTNNIVNTRTTYDIAFKTATTATIKTIEMNFPSSFDVRFTVGPSPKLIERSGIGSGTLSNPSDTKLAYTVGSPVTVSAGTLIRLEIGKIDNSETPDVSAEVSITTKDTGGNTIDGPTNSPSFVIKAIEGLDIDTNFMNRKTLLDDTAGHARGWDPNGVTTDFTIEDHDVQIDEEAVDQTFVTVMLRNSHTSNAVCMVNHTDFEFFLMNCIGAPPNGAQLHYEIHKLPANRITSTSLSSTTTSSTSSTISSPFSLLGEH